MRPSHAFHLSLFTLMVQPARLAENQHYHTQQAFRVTDHLCNSQAFLLFEIDFNCWNALTDIDTFSNLNFANVSALLIIRRFNRYKMIQRVHVMFFV